MTVKRKANGEDAVALILEHNQGREPERLSVKFRVMRANAFAFLRGAPHLFHRRMSEEGVAPEGPAAWQSGDLHLENFGSYIGDNGLAYFDLNDFDAGMLAPAPWDLVRLVASLYIAAPDLSLEGERADDLGRMMCEAWLETLRAGKARWIERRTADGPIGALLHGLRKRDPVAFLDARSRVKKGERRLRDDGKRMLPLPEKEKAKLAAFLHSFANGEEERRFFHLIDAARRIAGVSSLGAPRYSLLIEGMGSPDGNLLLDLKSAEPGAGLPYTPCQQPTWKSEAHRIVETQKLCQAVSMDYLHAVAFEGKPFVLRISQPTEDRLDLALLAERHRDFHEAAHRLADLSAWSQLRSSGRMGSASADALIAYAAGKGEGKRLDEAARRMAKSVLADWKAFCAAYDAGKLTAG